MKKVIAVTCQKGGIGKSTICCHLGRAFAEQNKKTIVVETDICLKSLDIFFSVKDVVYDLSDILNKNCSLKDAILNVPNSKNLYFISSPLNHDINIYYKNILNLLINLKNEFDIIILDIKSQLIKNLNIKKLIDIFLLVTTPDEVCVRDCSFFATYLEKNLDKSQDIRLIIKKIKKNFKKILIFFIIWSKIEKVSKK